MSDVRIMQVGDYLKDNDPRSSHRLLQIVSLGVHTAHGLERVFAKGKAGPQVGIQVKRIHSDGKPRRTGFTLIFKEGQES